MKKILTVITGIFLIMNFTAYGGELSDWYEASGIAELDKYIEGIRELDEDFSFDSKTKQLLTGENETPSKPAEKIINFFFGEINQNISLCMMILLISLCLGIISNFIPEGEKIFDTAFFVCYMIIFVLGIKTLETGIETGREAVDNMSFFMKSAVPVLGGLMAASGGMARTALISGNIIGVTTVMTIFTAYLFPICRISAFLCGVNNLSGDFNIKGISIALQRCVLWCLGIFIVVFSTILTTGSFAAVNLDNIAGKTTKYIVGNIIPIVGGVVSDTLENVLAYGKAVKGAAGGAGVLAMLYLCLVPVLKLFALLMTYRLSAIIISPFADKRICGVIEDFSLVIKIILSLVICSGIMFIIMIGIIAAP